MIVMIEFSLVVGDLCAMRDSNLRGENVRIGFSSTEMVRSCLISIDAELALSEREFSLPIVAARVFVGNRVCGVLVNRRQSRSVC